MIESSCVGVCVREREREREREIMRSETIGWVRDVLELSGLERQCSIFLSLFVI